MNTKLTEDERSTYQNPEVIRHWLHFSENIAIVGLSDKPQRASNFVGSYLKSEGYNIIPVNPMKEEILGEKSYPDLKSIPSKVDLVDIFRKPQDCYQIVEEAIEIGAKAVWMQLSIVNRDAAKLALENGLDVVMDRCIKMEHGRYNGNLHWVGMNTEIITAKKASRFF
ncbi:MAG: CoA-binding protein [Bacteroidota bacterium]